MFKKIAKDSFYLLFAEGIVKLAAFFISVMVARFYGPEIFGQYNFALSFTFFFSVLADFGFTTLIVKKISSKKDAVGYYFNVFLFGKIFFSLIALILLAASLVFIEKEPAVKAIILILGLYNLTNGVMAIIQAAFRAIGKTIYDAYIKIIASLALFSAVAAIIFLKKDIIVLSWASFFSVLFSFLVALFFISRKIDIPFLKIGVFFKKIIIIAREGWPFLATGMLWLVYFKIDTIMLSIMRNDYEVGIYNAGYSFFKVILVIPSMIMLAAFPSFTKLFLKNGEKFINLFKQAQVFILTGGIFFTLFFFFLSPLIINLSYGKEYAESILVLKLLSVILWMVFLSNLFLNVLNSTTNGKKVVLITLIGAVINVVLNFFLIPRYGYIGATVTTMITELAVFVLFISQVAKQVRSIKNNY